MPKNLIKKIKDALKSENPLDNVRDVVHQYEEIQRLVKWRNKIISSGQYHGPKVQEIEEVNEKIRKSGLYEETFEEQFNKEIESFFKKTK